MLALLILFLLTLPGCSTQSTRPCEAVVEIERVYIPVPYSLTEPLSAPVIADPLTWGDVADLAIQYRERWNSCEAARAEIRKLGAGGE